MKRSIVEKFYIDEEDSGIRVDVYLSNIFSDLSRSYIQKQIKNGNILVNNSELKPSQILKNEDEISVNIELESEFRIEPENIPLDIKYEDDVMLVVNKPKQVLL